MDSVGVCRPQVSGVQLIKKMPLAGLFLLLAQTFKIVDKTINILFHNVNIFRNQIIHRISKRFPSRDKNYFIEVVCHILNGNTKERPPA